MSVAESVAFEAPAISVLIVNFNSTDLLRRCLESVAKSTIAASLETIVVDNASADFDLAAAKVGFPWVTWLPQEKNRCFTEGTNIAFAASCGELVLLLNPDTVVEPDAIELAAAHMTSSPSTAAVGPYFVGRDGQLQRIYRRLPSPLDLPCLLFEPLFRHTARGREFLMSDESFEGITEVGHCPAAFVLIRRDSVEDHLLDPAYFNLLSDLELSRRVATFGRIEALSSVRCHHVGGGAGLGTSDMRTRVLLYHDLAWGVWLYYRQATALMRVMLNLMLAGYWLSRIAYVGIHSPASIPDVTKHAALSMLHRPPRYHG